MLRKRGAFTLASIAGRIPAPLLAMFAWIGAPLHLALLSRPLSHARIRPLPGAAICPRRNTTVPQRHSPQRYHASAQTLSYTTGEARSGVLCFTVIMTLTCVLDLSGCSPTH
jgi:hypothetical protein